MAGLQHRRNVGRTVFAQRTTDIVLLFSSQKEGRKDAYETLQVATASVKHLDKQREAPAKGTLPAAIISVTSNRSRSRTKTRSRIKSQLKKRLLPAAKMQA
ncbi:hypothetical protein ACLKA7_011318 [Drosophila subpalustris]